jgi:hypothetical protein
MKIKGINMASHLVNSMSGPPYNVSQIDSWDQKDRHTYSIPPLIFILNYSTYAQKHEHYTHDKHHVKQLQNLLYCQGRPL